MEPTSLILSRGTWFFQRGIYDHLNNIFKLKLEIIIMLELYETSSSCDNEASMLLYVWLHVNV